MGVVAEGLVERRAFTDRAVNQIAIGRVAQGENVGLNRNEQFLGRMGKLTEDRLAADDDELRRARDASGGADDVLKLVSLHGGGTGV